MPCWNDCNVQEQIAKEAGHKAELLDTWVWLQVILKQKSTDLVFLVYDKDTPRNLKSNQQILISVYSWIGFVKDAAKSNPRTVFVGSCRAEKCVQTNQAAMGGKDSP